MDLGGRLALLVAALVVAAGAWAWVQSRRGRLRSVRGAEAIPAAWREHAGQQLTLVQLSSRHCSACVRSARVWSDALAARSGIGFVEVDAEQHLDLVRELGVLTTPTTLVYDGDGSLRGRVTGAPTPRQATAVLSDEPIGAST